jgi:micrococcal nuclease
MPIRVLVTLILLAPLTWAAPHPTSAQATDCAGYDSQVWAQSVYDPDPGAYAALDPDGNGVVCEELQPGAAPALWTNAVPASAQPAELERVTDGDTIRVLVNGVNEPVRLILIDTPETVDPNRPVECFGQEASAFLSWLLSLGGTMYLERDVSDRDEFGRLLRYVWLDFGGGEVYLVNEALVRSGYAAQTTFPPDVKYEAQIREAAQFSREHGYGLWSACVTDATGDTNDLSDAQGIVAAPVAEPPPVDSAPAAEPMPLVGGCDPAYPDVCISSPPPDLDCGDIGPRRFTVLPPDPHRFDGDSDGIGCERD